MTDVALKNAEAKRDELSERIEANKAEIQRLSNAVEADTAARDSVVSFIAQWYEMAGLKPPKEDTVQTDLLGQASIAKAGKPKNPDRKYVAKVAAEIADATGRPLSRAEVAEGLRQRGIVLEGKDPMMVLSTMLWRTPETIARIEGFGYWPADKPYLPGNYVPPSE